MESDLDKFIDLYSSLGIDFEINYSEETGITYVIIAPSDFVGYNDESGITTSEKFKGESFKGDATFTHSRIEFSDGKFICQGFYDSVPTEGTY